MLRKILLPMLPTIKAKFLNDKLFPSVYEQNNTFDYLKLKILPSNYVPEFKGESFELLDGFNTTTIKAGKKRYSFTATINNGNPIIIENIMGLANTIPSTEFNSITILDFLNSESTSEDYIVRQGFISDIDLVGGRRSLGANTLGHLGLGIKFRFTEAEPRFWGF